MLSKYFCVQVLGTVKNAALVLFCVVFLYEPVSLLQATGYTVALAGFSWYQYIKMSAKPVSPKLVSKDSGGPFDVHGHKKHSDQHNKLQLAEGSTAVGSKGAVAAGDALSIRSEMSLEESETERDGLLGGQNSNSHRGGIRPSPLESLLLVDRTRGTPSSSRR